MASVWGDQQAGVFWWDGEGLPRTPQQAVEEFYARKILARELVDNFLRGDAEAFSVTVKTPINGKDLRAIISAAIEKGAKSKNPAQEMAKLRHAEDEMLKKDAIDYWIKNIDKSLSAQKAADILITYVKVSHKKLAEYISAEKKKLRSAQKVT